MASTRTGSWRHPNRKTHFLRVAVIRYISPCEFKRETCGKPARIQIEVGNGLSTPWHRDYCHHHAAPVLNKAKALGLTIIEN